MEEKSVKGIMQAIFNVQQKVQPIKKTSEGQVGTRKYNYANLNDTWEAIKPILKEEELVIYQSPIMNNGVGNHFKTTLHHLESGESITEIMQMILQRDDPQGIGAAITYYRRYMITTMLGLITDDDNDAREHRLATADQKKQIVGALKMTLPEVNTPMEINQALETIVGKHPSKIREDEASGFIDLIKSYKEDK